MPYITERWPGGLLTNFVTIRKAVKKMDSIDKMNEDGTIDTLSKRDSYVSVADANINHRLDIENFSGVT